MLKHFMMAAATAAALTACGQKTENGKAEAASAEAPSVAASAAGKKAVEPPAGFPKMTANYKAVYKLNDVMEGASSMTLEAAGARKLRFEMPHFDPEKAAAGLRFVGVFDDAKSQTIMYVDGPDAPKVGILLPRDQDLLGEFLLWTGIGDTKPRKTGSDRIAGLSCDVWATVGSDDGEPAQEACITRDGIILRAGEVGAAEPQMIALSVDKGAIPASRFVAPADFEVIDMGPCEQAMTEAMEAAQAGKMPDMAMMTQCQELSMKAAAIFGQ